MESSMKKRNEVIISRILEQYPDGQCALQYRDPFELLVASRLSAQCTDKRVNLVTKELFAKFPDAESFAHAFPEDIEPVIRPCGLYRMKAKDLCAMSRMLIQEFDGKLPDTMEGMLRLPGVGRKIANLMLGEVYGTPGVIVADTHCIRLANRLGLCDSKDPLRVENALRKQVDPQKSLVFCHALVSHGRTVCMARNPSCDSCFLRDVCPSCPLKK